MDDLPNRGALIAIEGLDKAGKTTQAKKLVQRLLNEGCKAQVIAFPDKSTSTGCLLDGYLGGTITLDDRAVHLLFAANRWEAQDRIYTALQEGTTVCMDRYAYSGVAYSAAKPGLTVEWCKQPDAGLLKPDLVCYLATDPEEAQHREGYGTERYETLHFQSEVRVNFAELMDETWLILSAEEDPENIATSLYVATKREMVNAKYTRATTLW